MLFYIIFFTIFLCVSFKVQVIDEHQKYVEKFAFEETFNSKVIKICSVIGGQSSGKSTLANGVFRTDFEVLNPRRLDGRKKTTQGIWIADAQTPPQCLENNRNTLLVFDIEGSDSYENRKQDGETFDNKAALFALAMSDVLIINIHELDVGKYRAGGWMILEKILQNIIKLYSQEGRMKHKTLLFVIQNYLGMTPVETLTAQIETMLKETWSTIENAANVDMRKLFTTVVYPLPFLLIPGTTVVNDTIVENLRQMFFNREHEKFLFKKEGEHHFVDVNETLEVGRNLWTRIQQNRNLDLQSQWSVIRDMREVLRKRTTPVGTRWEYRTVGAPDEQAERLFVEESYTACKFALPLVGCVDHYTAHRQRYRGTKYTTTVNQEKRLWTIYESGDEKPTGPWEAAPAIVTEKIRQEGGYKYWY